MGLLYRHGSKSVHIKHESKIKTGYMEKFKILSMQIKTNYNKIKSTTMHLKVLISLSSLHAFGKAAHNLVPSFLSE